MALTKVTGQVIKNTTDVTVGVLTVTNTLAVGGTVSIGGTLTYEDVTNVDSVGLITARNGIIVGSGITLSKDGDGFFTGVTTATTFVGALTGNVTGNISGGTVAGSTGTFTGDVDIASSLVHTGDTDTKISFATNTIKFDTDTAERVRITSGGKLLVGTSSDYAENVQAAFYGASNGGIALASGTSGSSRLMFADGTSGSGTGAYIGSIIYAHSDNSMRFTTNVSERLRIDSSGRLRVASTTESADGAFDDVIVGNHSGNRGISILSGATSQGAIGFAKSGTLGDGYIAYNHNSTATSSSMILKSSGRIQFNAGSTERLRIFSNGDIGVNATTINRSSTSRNTIQFDYSGSDGSEGLEIRLSNSALNGNAATDNAAITYIGQNLGITNRENGLITFSNNGSERVRVDSSGNVIIRDTSASRGVQITNGSTTGTNVQIKSTNDSAGIQFVPGPSGDTFEYQAAAGGCYVAYNRTDNTTGIFVKPDGGTCFGTNATTSLGSQTGAANVCTFNHSGITLTAYGVVAGFYYDRINFTNSQYYIVNSSGTGVYLGSGATSWSANSDERLKINITELDGTKAYNHVKTARATSFNWNATGHSTDKKIGFIAQDWETNYPEVVSTSTETVDGVDNPKGIRYTETVPVLMAALKEAIAKIETLETEVAALKGS